MSNTPEPGDYCQWGEYDCEVIKFDAEHEIVWVLVTVQPPHRHSGREAGIEAMDGKRPTGTDVPVLALR